MSQNTDPVLIAVISAGLSALVNSIFQIVNKIIDNKKEKQNKIFTKEQELKVKKEEIYASAIKNLMLLVTRNATHLDKNEIKDYDKRYLEIAPLIRLYSTDEIYDTYRDLQQFIRIAKTKGDILSDSFNRDYNNYITILSRLMQSDLQYREHNHGISNIITCPECGCEHDMYIKCPKCKMSYKQLIVKLKEISIQAQEIDNEDT